MEQEDILMTSLSCNLKKNDESYGLRQTMLKICESTGCWPICKQNINDILGKCKDWFFDFVSDVKNSKYSDENILYIGADEVLNFKLSKINSDFKKLNLKHILLDYEKSNKRLLFLDFEGTLPVAYQNSAFLSKDSPPSLKL